MIQYEFLFLLYISGHLTHRTK